jgi:galactosyl transferase GMA12/MNN10 family
MSLTIITLAIGEDYRKSLKKALESKRNYAEKHGYKYFEFGEEQWDRTRPIAWSKVPIILKVLNSLPEGSLVWQSDADVMITNQALRIEDHVQPLLPSEKDMLLTYDACHHINSGNILMRNTQWCRDFWRRVNERTDCTYHIWWENMAMIHLLEENPEDKKKIEISNQHKRFNAYVMGMEGEPLWEPGDFLVHFAGIYKPEKMKTLIEDIEQGKIPRIPLN